jgi:hypothetical protein
MLSPTGVKKIGQRVRQKCHPPNLFGGVLWKVVSKVVFIQNESGSKKRVKFSGKRTTLEAFGVNGGCCIKW